MSLADVLEAIERPAAWRWMIRRYFPAGPVCPNCSEQITGERAVRSFMEQRSTYCKACGGEFTPTAGTPIHGTSWQPEQFCKLLGLHLAGHSRNKIAEACGKSPACVRDMIDRIELQRQAATRTASVTSCAAATA